VECRDYAAKYAMTWGFEVASCAPQRQSYFTCVQGHIHEGGQTKAHQQCIDLFENVLKCGVPEVLQAVRGGMGRTDTLRPEKFVPEWSRGPFLKEK